ncbi:unnamed protein product [Orchesella dallaii]|uniref:Uncharacterized protein n=1 Tax=Orchesella dallaii TaxID=48710 RepID=A0ABP1QVA8_9HEXA
MALANVGSSGAWSEIQNVILNHFKDSTVQLIPENGGKLTQTIFAKCIILHCVIITLDLHKLESKILNKTNELHKTDYLARQLIKEQTLVQNSNISMNQRYTLTDLVLISDFVFPTNGTIRNPILKTIPESLGIERNRKHPTIIISSLPNQPPAGFSKLTAWPVVTPVTSAILLFVDVSTNSLSIGFVPCTGYTATCKLLLPLLVPLAFKSVPVSATSSMKNLVAFWHQLNSDIRIETEAKRKRKRCPTFASYHRIPVSKFDFEHCKIYEAYFNLTILQLLSLFSAEKQIENFPQSIAETLNRTDYELISTELFLKTMHYSSKEQRMPKSLVDMYIDIVRQSYFISDIPENQIDSLQSLSHNNFTFMGFYARPGHNDSNSLHHILNDILGAGMSFKSFKFNRFVIICERDCFGEIGFFGQQTFIRKVPNQNNIGLRSLRFWFQREPLFSTVPFSKFLASFAQSGLYEFLVTRVVKLRKLKLLRSLKNPKAIKLSNGIETTKYPNDTFPRRICLLLVPYLLASLQVTHKQEPQINVSFSSYPYSKMLVASNLLKYVEENIHICDYFGGIPFKWNKEKNMLEAKSRFKLKLYGIRFYFALLYKFFVMFQVISTWKNVKMFVITHNVMFISSYILITTCAYAFYKNAHRIASLFNQMIEYELRHCKPGTVDLNNVKGTTLVICMVRMMSITGIFLPTFYHLDMIRNPCFPVYLGYWLSEQCQEGNLGQALSPTWSPVELGTKIGMSLLSYMNWNLLMTGIGFYLNVAVILSGHCIRSYIGQYGQNMRKRFAKQEVIKKDQLQQHTMAFRELQVIAIEYRELYSRTVVVATLLCGTVMQVVCLYNTITVLLKGSKGTDADGSLQIGLNLVYFWCTIVAACGIVVFMGILADVYSVAKNVHQEIASTVALKRSKWFCRFLRSCPILRIYLGGSNFLDELTPLTCEDFAIDQTVGLLLLKN